MIDIHHHCLPGIDDGPRDMPAAVELCRRAFDEGITDIIATPHVHRDPWINGDRGILDRLREQLQSELGPEPRIHPGCEYFFSHDVLQQLDPGGAIVSLAGSRYVLVEFASTSIPPMIDKIFYEMGVRGFVAVIAHPERNFVFQKRPELLEMLVERGARTQITSGSLIGDFGRDAEKFSRAWLSRGLAHFIATDAHSMQKRPPVVRAAEKVLIGEVGIGIARRLLEENPAAVLRNEVLPFVPQVRPTPGPPSLSQRLSRFFG